MSANNSAGSANQPQLGTWRCPGVFREIETQTCPGCGDEVEFFPQDLKMNCLSCGAEVARESSSCLSHCPAKQSDCYREVVRQKMLAAVSFPGRRESKA